MPTVLTSDAANDFFEQIDGILADEHYTRSDQFIKLRQILEAVAREVTKQEPQYFSGLFNRMIFIEQNTSMNDGIKSRIHKFRKAANDAVHNVNIAISDERYKAGIQALCDYVAFLASVNVPELLLEYYTGNKAVESSPNAKVVAPPIVAIPVQATMPSALMLDLVDAERFMRATVVDIGDVQQRTSATGDIYDQRRLFCRVEQPGGIETAAVLLNGDWATTPIRPFATVHFWGLKHLKEDLFTTVAESLVVVEPDLLVQATAIAECFQMRGANPFLYLLNRFERKSSSKAMIKGNIVGEMLSERLCPTGKNYQDAFANACAANALALLTLPVSTVVDLFEEVKPHVDVLNQVIANLPSDAARVVEPTILSADYGLMGRPDALLASPSGLHHAIELKSGKHPIPPIFPTIGDHRISSDAWINHLIQAGCYDLLLRSAFRDAPQINSVLYSADPTTSLRSLAVTPLIRRELILMRNQLVDIDLALAAGETAVLDRINAQDFGIAPPFVSDTIETFADARSSLTAGERELFNEFVAFVAREYLIARVGGSEDDGHESGSGFSSLWLQTLSEKREEMSCLSFLSLVGEEEGDVTFSIRSRGEVVSDFREGDIVILYPHAEDGTAEPLRGQLWKGSLKAIDRVNQRVRVRLSNQHAVLPTASCWAVEHDFMDSSFAGLWSSLATFCEAPPERRALLLGQLEPRETTVASPADFKVDNPKHAALLAKIANSKDYFLLQGPPGTGKTRIMLRSVVEQKMKASEETLLILAFTNRAVSEICEAIDGVCEYIRFGSRASLSEHARQRHFDVIVEAGGLDCARQVMRDCRVVVSTVTTATRRPELFMLKSFNTAIVDEASQLLEPHLLGILSEVDRFILIGDEKQLPAVVTQPKPQRIAKSPALKAIGITNLSMSLFERLLRTCQNKGWTHAHGMLEEQGRMHADIQEFPSRRFYAGRLLVANESQQAPSGVFRPDSTDTIERAMAFRRFFLVSSPRAPRRSKTHAEEAERVAQFVSHIRTVYQRTGRIFDPARSIGIITPFRAQIAEIYSHLPDDLQDVMVDTVERFQGGQRDIILVSFAVQHARQVLALESLNDDETIDRKLNVALTRAREHLVLFGDARLLQRHRLPESGAQSHLGAMVEYLGTERKAVILNWTG